MLWVAIVVTVAALIGVVSSYFLGDENPIEEACEEIIKIETGKEIELSVHHKLYYKPRPSSEADQSLSNDNQKDK